MRAYRNATFVLALVFVGLGIALIALGVARGDWLRTVIGALFTAVGTARLQLLRRGR